MGYSGHCRLRPVHLSGLVKRYRQLLGELRYVDQHKSEDSLRRSSLSEAISALAGAIRICNPEVDLLTVQPLPYRPPELLPDAALTRAILTALRLSINGLTVDALVPLN